jgi:thiamine-phosphate pyrophosphorylase
MPDRCLLYYITDRTAFPGDERSRRSQLLDKIAEAAANGIDYIQLREKDLPPRELESLARDAMRILTEQQLRAGNQKPATALVINSRTDVGLATHAAGVHLPANDVLPQDVLKVWHRNQQNPGAGAPAREIPSPVISVSCHSIAEVSRAEAGGATFAIFAPVFEKKGAPGIVPSGLESLREACRADIPILALGGITLANAESCLRSGAAGIAAIRLFQENDIATVVRALRG